MDKELYLYLVTNRIGSFYVVSSDPTSAKERLEAMLKQADYGFSGDREVKEIKILSKIVKPTMHDSPCFFDRDLILDLDYYEYK